VQNKLLPEADDDCKCAQAQRELTEIVMRRLAGQDETIAQMQADFDGLRELVRQRETQLLAFADVLESASGCIRREAGLLADLLRGL
jgi:hypothetical protein